VRFREGSDFRLLLGEGIEIKAQRKGLFDVFQEGANVPRG
jgi:hypothetical protein